MACFRGSGKSGTSVWDIKDLMALIGTFCFRITIINNCKRAPPIRNEKVRGSNPLGSTIFSGGKINEILCQHRGFFVSAKNHQTGVGKRSRRENQAPKLNRQTRELFPGGIDQPVQSRVEDLQPVGGQCWPEPLHHATCSLAVATRSGSSHSFNDFKMAAKDRATLPS